MCRGARPIFSARATVMRVRGMGWESSLIAHCPVNHAFVELANRIIAAAVAWVRKYLVEASTDRGWWCCAIKGIIANVLISKPIHATSQCELVSVIVVPNPSPKRRIKRMYGFIDKGRVINLRFWGMGPIAYLADFTLIEGGVVKH